MSPETHSPVADAGDTGKTRERSAYERRKPHSCSGCPTRWASLREAHCGNCHEHFATVSLFDRHRSPNGPHGFCRDPHEVGLRLVDGVWHGPQLSPEQRLALYGRYP